MQLPNPHFVTVLTESKNYLHFCVFILGVEIICAGSPGHGSIFIENNAGEKLVSS